MSGAPSVPTIGTRAFARFADVVLVMIPVWLFIVPLAASALGGGILVIAVCVAFGYVVTAGYEGYLTSVSGQTFGKRASGLRVVMAEDPSSPPPLGRAVARASIPLATGALFAALGPLSALAGWMAPYLMAMTAADKRGLHDRLTGTQVVALTPGPGTAGR